MQVPADDLEKSENEWKVKSLGSYKKADNVRFFRWRDAVMTSPDGIARAAIAQLLAEELP